MEVLSNNTRFDGLIAARNNETTIRWQKVQVFLLINSALLSVIAGASFSLFLKLIGCLFGLAVTMIWWMMQWEAQNAIDYWNKRLAELEAINQNVITPAFAFTKPREGFRFRFISTHHLILTIAAIFALGWIGLIIYLTIV